MHGVDDSVVIAVVVIGDAVIVVALPYVLA